MLDFTKIDLGKIVGGLHLWLVFAALSLNIFTCLQVYPGPADGTAAAYRVYGRAYGRITGPIGVREPAPVFPVKVLVGAGIPVPLAAKITGLSAFAGLVWLTLVFLRKRYGEAACAIGALLLAANPYFGYYAVKGPGEIFPLLFFLAFWRFVEKKDFSIKNICLAAVCAALAALSKIIFLAFIFGALGLWALEERSAKCARFALSCALIAFAMASPYLIYQKLEFGSALSLQDNLLGQWRNIELEGPAAAALFKGPPLGPMEFIFGEGPRRSCAVFASGARKIFVSGLPELAYYHVELFFGLLGLAMLFVKKHRPFASLAFLFLLPVAFIAAGDQVAVVGGIEPRFYLGVFWLVCCYAGFAFQELLEMLMHFTSPASVREP
jgi:hypothetical protein